MAEKTLKEAAVELLRERGPLHYQTLTDEVLQRGVASSSSKTPAASLNAVIAVDIKRNDPDASEGERAFVASRVAILPWTTSSVSSTATAWA